MCVGSVKAGDALFAVAKDARGTDPEPVYAFCGQLTFPGRVMSHDKKVDFLERADVSAEDVMLIILTPDLIIRAI